MNCVEEKKKNIFKKNCDLKRKKNDDFWFLNNFSANFTNPLAEADV
jgi:hypothetical protein